MAPGNRVGVQCHSGSDHEYFDGFHVQWYLDVVESAGGSVTLSDNPAYDRFRLATSFVNEEEEPAIVHAKTGR